MGILDAPARPSKPHANTIVWLGDSVTEIGGGIPANPHYASRGFWTNAQSLLGHRLRTLANLGVGGQTTTQILARVNDAIALKPGWCHVQGGTNDIGGGATSGATIKANLTSMWDALDRAGIRVITGTIPPRSSYTGVQKAVAEDVNAWLRWQGRTRRNLIVVDYHAVLVHPGNTGAYAGGLTYDGTHPSSTGAYLMGRALATVLDPLVPKHIELSASEGDSANLIKAGRFTVGGNGVTPGGGWGDHLPVGTTWSKRARTDGLNGEWQVFTVPNGAGVNSWEQYNIPVDANLAVGDQFVVAVEYDLSNLDTAAASGQQGFYMELRNYDGTNQPTLIKTLDYTPNSGYNMPATARSGVLRTPPVRVPAGTTQILVLVWMIGGGTYALDRATALNLTKLGREE